jgi:hypothetical protein
MPRDRASEPGWGGQEGSRPLAARKLSMGVVQQTAGEEANSTQFLALGSWALPLSQGRRKQPCLCDEGAEGHEGGGEHKDWQIQPHR